jgi:hypothetical protein
LCRWYWSCHSGSIDKEYATVFFRTLPFGDLQFFDVDYSLLKKILMQTKNQFNQQFLAQLNAAWETPPDIEAMSDFDAGIYVRLSMAKIKLNYQIDDAVARERKMLDIRAQLRWIALMMKYRNLPFITFGQFNDLKYNQPLRAQQPRERYTNCFYGV